MNVDFDKTGGLVPAVIQDAITGKVLMLAYMNREALEKTRAENRVTFFSRSKKRLWTKGETSGNFLDIKEILMDCDRDTLLIKVSPHGPACHTGTDTCFGEINREPYAFINELQVVIESRRKAKQEGSYTASLFAKGLNKIAQKVGEEAVELIIEAKDNNDELFLNEAADLYFHLLILLRAKGFRFEDVLAVLEKRKK